MCELFLNPGRGCNPLYLVPPVTLCERHLVAHAEVHTHIKRVNAADVGQISIETLPSSDQNTPLKQRGNMIVGHTRGADLFFCTAAAENENHLDIDRR